MTRGERYVFVPFLFDESGAFPDNRDRWLYTGVTRAAKRLTVVV